MRKRFSIFMMNEFLPFFIPSIHYSIILAFYHSISFYQSVSFNPSSICFPQSFIQSLPFNLLSIFFHQSFFLSLFKFDGSKTKISTSGIHSILPLKTSRPGPFGFLRFLWIFGDSQQFLCS